MSMRLTERKGQKVKSEASEVTNHALRRMKERGIPASLIEETLRNGKKTFLYSRKAVEYRLKNILGLRGVNLIVIQGLSGSVITSYVEKVRVKPKSKRW